MNEEIDSTKSEYRESPLSPLQAAEPVVMEQNTDEQSLPAQITTSNKPVAFWDSPKKLRSLAILIGCLAVMLGAITILTTRHKPEREPRTATPKVVSSSTPMDSNSSTTSPVAVSPECSAPTNYPPAPAGGMSYVNWTFNQPNIYSLIHSVDIKTNPGLNSDLYLQLYDGNIDNTGQYYGLQTTGLVLFSQFGTTNSTDNVKPAPGSTAVFGTNEGPFISLRRNFGSLPTGHYTTNMLRTNYDATGDWFAYYVTFPGQAETYIGSMRFPRANPAVPATFRDGGGTWTEFWDNNGTILYPVPEWNVAVGILANKTIPPEQAISTYSAMPNSDTSIGTNERANFVLGGMTPRCHPAGRLR